jgi:glycine cleavage system protein P-like pyridoxal-binding family
MTEALIFDQSRPGAEPRPRRPLQAPSGGRYPGTPAAREPPQLPEVSELQVVRHYTRLSQKNFSIDTQFYPLGSCTMKYNPRASNTLAMLPGFLERHPWAPESHSQGVMACLHELQEMLARSHRHGRRQPHPHGRRAGRVRRRGDDPRLPSGTAAIRSAPRSWCRMPPTAPTRPPP